jgi:hypothetical protein
MDMPRIKLGSTSSKVLIGAALVLAMGGAGLAQPAPPASAKVTVRIGPALAAKTPRLGEPDVSALSKDLADTVRDDLAGRRRPNAPVKVNLVLEDATPNRPTAQQLSDHPYLSLNSISVGGAAISGVATFADGHSEPFSYNFRQVSLQYDVGATQWTDAERAFEELGNDLAHGHLPHDRLDIRVADSGFDQWRR